MANFVFNISKGKIGYYTGLPATNDGLVVVPLENTGLEADAALKDHANLSALLAGSSNEQTTMGRVNLTSVTWTVDNTNERADGDFADVTWANASGNQVGALVVCYVPDVGVSADTEIIPLTKHDWVFTPSGGNVTAQVAAAGFARAAEV